MVFHKLKTALEIFTTYPLFILSHLIPRDKNTWVCIGWHRGKDAEIFADNTKYLFLYVSQHIPDKNIIWLAKDRKLAQLLQNKGYRSYYEKSLLGAWSALRAKITLVDANLLRENARFSGGTTLIQLLHGKGYKKTGYTTKPIKKFDYVFVPSGFVADLLPKPLTDTARIRVTGYPRDDVFFGHIKDSDIGVADEVITKLKETQHSSIIWYAPTFRRGQTVFDINTILEPEKLRPWLQKNNLYLFVSLHPKYREQMRDSLGERIFFVPESDIYPILSHVDILVNDYSSLFTDFLLLDKPIIFYPYDLQTYEKEEGFNIDYMSYSPGPKAYNINQFMNEIENTLQNDMYQHERTRVKNSYHAFTDGHSSERAVEEILKITD